MSWINGLADSVHILIDRWTGVHSCVCTSKCACVIVRVFYVYINTPKLIQARENPMYTRNINTVTWKLSCGRVEQASPNNNIIYCIYKKLCTYTVYIHYIYTQTILRTDTWHMQSIIRLHVQILNDKPDSDKPAPNISEIPERAAREAWGGGAAVSWQVW